MGALCNFVGYYFIGFPIGVSLMFAAGMGIMGKGGKKGATHLLIQWCVQLQSLMSVSWFFPSLLGFWTGLLVCVSVQALFFIIFLSKLNWKKASEEVSLHSCTQNAFSILPPPPS